ncbi:uncharacterized protein EV420DRAFT_348801 [Desarmillaria tabescens]|uniref:F-box domain-containing protein n=1 Tax=Armillaria tabescens TaxID=1929756 RepID=A0AA39J4F2_ARMTA|nr:uncharacterized protein EV420DRAFT_348801 [Desarmillaria tabescens]KAK0435086.1 hypothetical protein EV420DRAFT_348801 [Desarmillaria tabescens]
MDAKVTVLPQELIDAVIDENHTDKETLRTCSLVSRSWTYPSQRRIFSHISFNRGPYHYCSLHGRRRRDIERFNSFISIHPCLATLVKSIEISPLLDAHLLGTMFQKLINLESISLHLCGYSWDELSLSMRDTLITAFRSLRLTRFEIRDGLFLHYADFLALLDTCQYLKHLSLSAISCEDLVSCGNLEGLTRLPNGLKLKLHSLALSLCEPHSSLVQLLQSSINISSLQQLSVLTDGSGDLVKRTKVTRDILRQLNGSALEHLVLNACLGEPLSNLIDISRLRSIHVKLWWICYQQHTKPVVWLRWLTSLFKELTKWHRLEKVTLEIFYTSTFTSYGNDWAALDATLGQIGSLRRVHLGLDAYDNAKARWKHLMEHPSCAGDDVRSIFPMVAKRRILSVECAANYPG